MLFILKRIMAIGKTFIQILGPKEQFPNNPGFPTLFLQKQSDVQKTVFGFNDGNGNTFSAFLVLEKGNAVGNKLSKIFDVNISNPTNGQSLVFDSINSKWINQTISGSGGTGPSTYIQPGSNILTGGTSSAPVISITNSPSFNNITASGSSQFSILTGGTFISGTTNLYNIFIPVQQLAYKSLTLSASTTLDINNQGFFNYFLSSSLSAATFSFLNFPNGSTITLDYLKTTASNVNLSFPVGTIVSLSSNCSITGTSATLISTSSGRFTITIVNVNNTYKTYIVQDIA